MVALHGYLSSEGKLSGSASVGITIKGKLSRKPILNGKISPSGVLSGKISASKQLHGTLTIAAGDIPSYHGETEITPSNAVQIIECGGLVVPSNIIVDAIPSNYGLIAWDGVTLSVS